MSDVAERLGVCWLTWALRVQTPGSSTKSIYKRQKQFLRLARVIQEVDALAYDIRRLKRDLARVTELSLVRNQSGRLFSRRMWDLLKKATQFFAAQKP